MEACKMVFNLLAQWVKIQIQNKMIITYKQLIKFLKIKSLDQIKMILILWITEGYINLVQSVKIQYHLKIKSLNLN